jgi:hypothetical protein
MTEIKHVYELRPRKDKRGVDLISDALPFGRLWYAEPNAVANAISVKLAAPDKGCRRAVNLRHATYDARIPYVQCWGTCCTTLRYGIRLDLLFRKLFLSFETCAAHRD